MRSAPAIDHALENADQLRKMPLHRESRGHLTSAERELFVVLRRSSRHFTIASARPCRRRRRSRCEMSVDPFMQPLRNAADGECRRRHAVSRGRHAHRAERLRPHAGHDEQPRFAHQRAKPRFLGPSGKRNRSRHALLRRSPRPRFPPLPIRPIACEDDAQRLLQPPANQLERCRAGACRPSDGPCVRQTGCRTIWRRLGAESVSRGTTAYGMTSAITPCVASSCCMCALCVMTAFCFRSVASCCASLSYSFHMVTGLLPPHPRGNSARGTSVRTSSRTEWHDGRVWVFAPLIHVPKYEWMNDTEGARAVRRS